MRKNIKLRVKNLVNKYQTADPFALAKELDVNILYVPLPKRYVEYWCVFCEKRLFY